MPISGRRVHHALAHALAILGSAEGIDTPSLSDLLNGPAAGLNDDPLGCFRATPDYYDRRDKRAVRAGQAVEEM